MSFGKKGLYKTILNKQDKEAISDKLRKRETSSNSPQKKLFTELKVYMQEIKFKQKGLIPNKRIIADIFIPSTNIVVCFSARRHHGLQIGNHLSSAHKDMCGAFSTSGFFFVEVNAKDYKENPQRVIEDILEKHAQIKKQQERGVLQTNDHNDNTYHKFYQYT
ncbi:hypothetical protein [Hydrogenovibrio marinus]|uniref:DUF559 domain-containing protein n=1 Tax=Hydrogenovibrio marinus TaxID=28885 RepID=A0A066ZXB1_HYDMR|nr:hypothetical protein [Hydrogenovibrio marinus]KDN94705.1 hypothetical protein EI16_12475 [Hydrogenovibrio marinus]